MALLMLLNRAVEEIETLEISETIQEQTRLSFDTFSDDTGCFEAAMNTESHSNVKITN